MKIQRSESENKGKQARAEDYDPSQGQAQVDKINMLTDRVKNLTKENELLATEIGELRKSTESIANIKTVAK